MDVNSTTCPRMADIEFVVDWHCLQNLSGKCYQQYVSDEVGKKIPWALEMTKSVSVVMNLFSFWCNQLDLIAKRNNGGFSTVCRLIPNSMPITRSLSHMTLQDCVITGQRKRPCFSIQSCKNTEEPIFVHHSFLSVCQSIWSVSHLGHIIDCCILNFKKKNISSNLSEICNLFKISTCRRQLCNYIEHILLDVQQIFTRDNVICI